MRLQISFGAVRICLSLSSRALRKTCEMTDIVSVLGVRGRLAVDLPSTKLVIDSSCIGWIILDSTTVRSANVIDLSFLTEFNQVLSTIESLSTTTPRQVKAVVVWSAKSRSFIVGADIRSIYPVTDISTATDAARAGQTLCSRLASLKIPTIAAINGACLGGGLEVALACSIRVAADDDYRIGLPETQLGLIPGAGGTVRLPKLIGIQAALPLILGGKQVTPSAAKRLGIVDRVLQAKDRFEGEQCFFNEVRKVAARAVDRPLSSKGGKSWMKWLTEENQVAQSVLRWATTKQLDKTTKGRYPAPYAAMESVLRGSFTFEAQQFGRLAVSPEAKNLMSLFLMTDGIKRDSATAAAQFDVKGMKIGVVGAGVMGSAIAQLCATCGFRVYMRDISQELVAKGLKNVASLFAEIVKKKRMTAAAAAEKRALISSGTAVDGFADCDIVIEAAVERMDLKKKILAEVERVTKESSIFATNTSSLSIAELAEASTRPSRVVGMHFFNPVSKMPLVEVIRGPRTDAVVAQIVTALTLSLKKTPVQCHDGPGFIVNRVLGIYMGEATHLLAQGGSVAAIDSAIRDGFGMPMGPFRLMDEVGLDVAFHVAPILHKGLGERFQMNPAFKRMLDAGLLGKKNGRGFYLYDPKTERSTGVNPQLKSILGNVIPSVPAEIATQEIIDRCVLLMVNEASHILGDGVADRPEDIDIGMIFGTGFAPFRGGLLAYAEQRGIGNVVDALRRLEKKYGARFAPAPYLVNMVAEKRTRFFPDRPLVPYVERTPRFFRAKL
ncbi:mitochondrial enoyl-CoA hydratase / long-chain 3-hydroxyacyl-CoA dehydrogenase [Andalucia godoyi]|uniref:Mitochondrial enoyl-CoA hydratase / long-chain 3-hydroxyacyl-CoA dehydrogenase n=1 Tax=Andalucia godoyi TaxID=505711 RepID=A0A8K0F2F8_ANDGO|nr:mitochondrial enoyl-CoA hydratase / long-chain 3-hydroxyacyl-CoA dehydrogenase [Andalucia godoyi]|eukprot:ANDGO_01818.mRNA.1 mitochondrial enoyl-CoA hydratase / long-chain 3-hydroxyacyl-CoA dehydrogenase